jgi:protein-histidine pros-kinase
MQKIETFNIKGKENDFLKLINIIPDAIVIVNQEGIIEYINSKTIELFGQNEAELIGKTVEVLLPNRFRLNHAMKRAEYSKTPKTRQMGSGLDLYGRRKNSSEFPVDIMLSPIETGNGILTISVIRDITERKKIEEDTKKQARQLEDIVSAMTHDLKTPLLAAETSLNYLLNGYFGDLNKNQKEIISLMHQSNANALRLVKNLLSVFKYESKFYKLLLELCDISELVNKSINSVKPMLENKKIKLANNCGNFKFICDSFEIQRVLENLLTNSIKYTPEGGNIILTGIKDENGTVKITIEDNGNGIPKEDLPNIFERFWQSRKLNSDSGSTGLGLYLSRHIIDAHGGKIWAESQLGKGTKIIIEIPELLY